MSGFYEFRQNNSGGSIVVDSKLGIGEYVYIWAKSWEEANDKAGDIGLLGLPYCECCGKRFYSLWENDKPMKNGVEGDLSSLEDEIAIFFHFSGEVKGVVIPNPTKGGIITFTWSEEALMQLTAG